MFCKEYEVTSSTKLFGCFFHPRTTRGQKKFVVLQRVASCPFLHNPRKVNKFETRWLVVKTTIELEGTQILVLNRGKRVAILLDLKLSTDVDRSNIEKLPRGSPVMLNSLLID